MATANSAVGTSSMANRNRLGFSIKSPDSSDSVTGRPQLRTGSSERMVRGPLFPVSSASANNVLNISSFGICSFRIAFSAFFYRFYHSVPNSFEMWCSWRYKVPIYSRSFAICVILVGSRSSKARFSFVSAPCSLVPFIRGDIKCGPDLKCAQHLANSGKSAAHLENRRCHSSGNSLSQSRSRCQTCCKIIRGTSVAGSIIPVNLGCSHDCCVGC